LPGKGPTCVSEDLKRPNLSSASGLRERQTFASSYCASKSRAAFPALALTQEVTELPHRRALEANGFAQSTGQRLVGHEAREVKQGPRHRGDRNPFELCGLAVERRASVDDDPFKNARTTAAGTNDRLIARTMVENAIGACRAQAIDVALRG